MSVLAVDDGVAAALVEDPRVGKIVFTGSVATGKKVMAAAAKNLTPVVLELGGKDAAIVCRDADLELAARGVVWNAFMNAGQTCSSVERVYVERPVLEPFLAKVLDEARRVRLKDAAGAGEVGPLTLERQRRVVEAHVADAVAKGARVLLGGERPTGPGFFYPPTVVVDVDHDMALMRDETFGPVLPVMAVDSLDDAIRLANDSAYGLTASGWTRSEETAVAAAARARGRRRLDQRPLLELRRAAGAVGRREGERDRPHPRAGRPARDGAAALRELRPREASPRCGGTPTIPSTAA